MMMIKVMIMIILDVVVNVGEVERNKIVMVLSFMDFIVWCKGYIINI